MSKPKIKQISHIDEADDDPDTCIFYLSYNEDMTQVMLTVQTKRPLTPDEYLDSVADFLNNVSESPEQLFVEDATPPEGLH
jgi:hypothetical protein